MAVAPPTPKKKRKKGVTGLTVQQWRSVFAEAARQCGPTIGACMRNAIAEVKRRYGIA